MLGDRPPAFVLRQVTEPGNYRAEAWLKVADAAVPPANADILKRAINGVGESCDEVTRAFYQGGNTKTGTFWNRSLSERRSYTINQNSMGAVSVMSCALMKRVAGITCFESLK